MGIMRECPHASLFPRKMMIWMKESLLGELPCPEPMMVFWASSRMTWNSTHAILFVLRSIKVYMNALCYETKEWPPVLQVKCHKTSPNCQIDSDQLNFSHAHEHETHVCFQPSIIVLGYPTDKRTVKFQFITGWLVAIPDNFHYETEHTKKELSIVL